MRKSDVCAATLLMRWGVRKWAAGAVQALRAAKTMEEAKK